MNKKYLMNSTRNKIRTQHPGRVGELHKEKYGPADISFCEDTGHWWKEGRYD